MGFINHFVSGGCHIVRKLFRATLQPRFLKSNLTPNRPPQT